ncbi:MAG: hypothetical protein AAB320_03325 [Elusimicrobiota bacterium]
MNQSWEVLKLLRWRAGGATRALCAGSGLARVRGGFWAVADDLNHLVRIPDGAASGRGYRLFSGEPPSDAARRKRVKKDIESLIDLGGGRLIAFPSGSKDRRCRGSLITLDGRGGFVRATEIDFRPLMRILADKIPDLNIEGGFVSGSRLILLQRGNGRSGLNARVKLRLKGFLRGLQGRWRRSALRLKIKRAPLGSLGGVALSFTDGFFHDGVAYFAAAAEAGKDTCLDGRIAGSVVGMLPRRGKPVVLARLKGEKIEGLALKSEKDGLLEVCAVTDADDPRRPSRLLRAWIKK